MLIYKKHTTVKKRNGYRLVPYNGMQPYYVAVSPTQSCLVGYASAAEKLDAVWQTRAEWRASVAGRDEETYLKVEHEYLGRAASVEAWEKKNSVGVNVTDPIQ